MNLLYFHILNIKDAALYHFKNGDFLISLNNQYYIYFDLNLCLCILGKDLKYYLCDNLNLFNCMSHFIINIYFKLSLNFVNCYLF